MQRIALRIVTRSGLKIAIPRQTNTLGDMDDTPIRAVVAELPMEAEVVEHPLCAPALLVQPRISHLLLWLLGASIVFWLEYSRLTVVTPIGLMYLVPFNDNQRTYVILSRLIVAPTLGISIAVGTLSLLRLLLGRLPRAPQQAGYWILFQFAAWLISDAVLLLVAYLNSLRANSPLTDSDFGLLKVVGYLASGLIAGCACAVLPEPRWRIFFGGNTAIAVIILLTGLYYVVPEALRAAQVGTTVESSLLLLATAANTILSLVVSVALFIGVIGDPSHQRDAVHWAGIGCWCIYVLLVIGDTAAVVYLRHS